MRTDSAFSMIELIVVMAIIGIVAGTTIIKTDPFGIGSDQEFRQILTFLRLQHARALSEQSALTIRFDPDEDRISVRTEEEFRDQLRLDQWSISEPTDVQTIRFSPYRQHSLQLSFTNPSGTKRTLRPDVSLGYEILEQ